MLNQIINMYKEQLKAKNAKIGLKRFSKSKRLFLCCIFILSIIASLTMIVTFIISIFNKNEIQNYILFISLSISVILNFIIYIVCMADEKTHSKEYRESYLHNISILNKILKNTFKINTAEKLQIIIDEYQKIVAQYDETNNKIIRIITFIFSALGTILSISFINMNNIGLVFKEWLILAIIMTILVSLICAIIYTYYLFFNQKYKYEDMLNKVKSVLLYYY